MCWITISWHLPISGDHARLHMMDFAFNKMPSVLVCVYCHGNRAISSHVVGGCALVDNLHSRERMYPVTVAVPQPPVEPDGNFFNRSRPLAFDPVDPLLRLRTTKTTISRSINLHLRSRQTIFSFIRLPTPRSTRPLHQDWLGGIQHTLIDIHTSYLDRSK